MEVSTTQHNDRCHKSSAPLSKLSLKSGRSYMWLSSEWGDLSQHGCFVLLGLIIIFQRDLIGLSPLLGDHVNEDG